MREVPWCSHLLSLYNIGLPFQRRMQRFSSRTGGYQQIPLATDPLKDTDAVTEAFLLLHR